MLHHSSQVKRTPQLRQAAREQAAAAVQQWLDLEGEATQPTVGPGRRVVGPWPFATVVLGALTSYGAYVWDSMPGMQPIAVTFGMCAGGLLLAGAGIGTAIERVRQRLRLSNLVRAAALALAQERPEREPQAPVTPEPPLPQAIAVPLERARAACAGITRIAGDPAWTRLKVPVKEHEASARAQLKALEERARRLAMVDEVLASPGEPGALPDHLRGLAGVYQAHCEGMLAAAEIFERAQASLARALLALTAGTPTAPDAALHDIGAAFDSLAQVLESLGRAPDLAEAPPAAAVQPERALR